MRSVVSERLLIVASALLAITGCAMTTPPPDDLDLRLQAAEAAFGGGFEYLHVKSAGELADQAFVTMSRASRSEMARELGTTIAPAEKRAIRILVTGKAPAKTKQVILDALSFHSEGGLPGLELLFLGEPEDAESVRTAVERVGGQFRFAPYRN